LPVRIFAEQLELTADEVRKLVVHAFAGLGFG
jgi:hypothetical protein